MSRINVARGRTSERCVCVLASRIIVVSEGDRQARRIGRKDAVGIAMSA